MRTCCGCKTHRPKADLIRFHAGRDGELMRDMGGVPFGRGAYLCPDIECMQKALKKGAFARTLRVPHLRWNEEVLRARMGDARSESADDSGETVHGENFGR